MQALRDSPDGLALELEGRVQLVGAIYDLTSGRVRFLDPLPD
jgi:carbonic anhydrase